MTPAESSAESKRFNSLLSALDRDRDRAGEKYESLRQRLTTLFRCHGFPEAHDLVDETFRRLESKLDEGNAIQNLSAYAAGIARHICLEQEKKGRKIDLDDFDSLAKTDMNPEEQAELELWSRCLDRCLTILSERDQRLILGYYDYAEGRKAAREERKAASRQRLAGALGLSNEALRGAACRARNRIEHCVRGCVARRAAE